MSADKHTFTCSAELLIINYYIFSCFVVFQEHHDEDLFLYMTYSNESVYGAWGRKKDWRRREREWEETKWDGLRIKKLKLFVNTIIILYISFDKQLQYTVEGRLVKLTFVSISGWA